MTNILIDTGFWFAYLGTRHDSLQERALTIYERFIDPGNSQILIPFPVLYETINTKLLRDKNQKAADWFLKKLVVDPLYVKISDEMYREIALNNTINFIRNRGISLVDSILRTMMQDDSLRISALITFNSGDFSDVCFKKRIQLIDQYFESGK